MSIDRIVPTQQNATARPRPRCSVPRGLTVGTLIAIALTWGLFEVVPGSSLLSAQAQTGIFLGLLLLTICSRRAKVLVARTFQRCVLNPLMRLLLTVGVNPLGLAILETRGHRTGKTRRVPVGNGRKGDSFWIIAEHGTRAGYVHNIQHDPRVRVRLRLGVRYRWVDGIATVRPDEPLARQRRVIASLAPAARAQRDVRARLGRRPARRACTARAARPVGSGEPVGAAGARSGKRVLTPRWDQSVSAARASRASSAMGGGTSPRPATCLSALA
jgi:deazaflavin-dependent oxidoreductase (nitroreductase family)